MKENNYMQAVCLEIFHGINIIVDFVSTDPNTFNLFTLRSFGETFYHHVTDAALEYGFIAI